MNGNNVSDLSAMVEKLREVYAERDRLQAENEELKNKIETFTAGRKAQEDFTEEAAQVLGVNPDNLSLSDILTALKKAKDMKDIMLGLSGTCTDLKNERNEALRKLKRCEELNNMNSNIIAGLSVTIHKICAELAIECGTDTTPDDICNSIQQLRAYRDRSRYCPIEEYNRICDILGTDKNNSSWNGILNAVYELYTEKIDLSTKVFGQQQAIKQFESSLNNARSDIIREGVKRKEWVGRYEPEHKRANSCDKLYNKYKALYDANESKYKKMADDLQVCHESYKVIKNTAVKNRSMMDAVKRIVGTEGLHDDVTLTAVQNAKKKADHWDILVNGYGNVTISSLLMDIGTDVTGDRGYGLF